MTNLKLKSQLSDLVREHTQPVMTVVPSLAWQQEKLSPGANRTLTFARLALLLQRLTGVILGGIAVSAQIASVLVCICMLLLGPSFIARLLG